jgi:hypothetical protein
MKLAAISFCGPFDTFILNRVHQQWPISLVLQPDWTQSVRRRSAWSKLRSDPLGAIGKRAHRLFYERLQRRINDGCRRALFGVGPVPGLSAPCQSVPLSALNSAETASLLANVAPDVLLVCGAPILKPVIFGVPRLGTINVHRGITPHYRGEDTIFWALQNRDFDHVGVTIHFVDQAVDTGPVIAQGFPALAAGDGESVLLARCAEHAAAMICDSLGPLEQGWVGQSLTGAGRQYFRRERTVWQQARYHVRSALNRHRLAARPERQQSFLIPPPVSSAKVDLGAAGVLAPLERFEASSV